MTAVHPMAGEGQMWEDLQSKLNNQGSFTDGQVFGFKSGELRTHGRTWKTWSYSICWTFVAA